MPLAVTGGEPLEAPLSEAHGRARKVNPVYTEGQLVRVAGDDAGEVHHLGEADHAAATQQALEVAPVQGAMRRLERRGRHASGAARG